MIFGCVPVHPTNPQVTTQKGSANPPAVHTPLPTTPSHMPDSLPPTPAPGKTPLPTSSSHLPDSLPPPPPPPQTPFPTAPFHMPDSPHSVPDVGVHNEPHFNRNVVVKSRLKIPIRVWKRCCTEREELFERESSTVSRQLPLKVLNPVQTEIVYDTRFWYVPPVVTDAIINFGNIRISKLFDNDLNLCGHKSNHHCDFAGIRIYMDNDLGNEMRDMVLYVTLFDGTSMLVPPRSEATTPIQQLKIPNDVQVVRGDDFIVPLMYHFTADFRDRSCGEHRAVLIIEYLLFHEEIEN